MDGREGAFLQKGQSGGELLLGLPGEAHDQVGGDAGAVKVPAEKVNALQIPGGVVLPVHPLQGGVAARLEGEVEVRT